MFWTFSLWTASIGLLFFVAIRNSGAEQTRASTFCAYGRVFVEFEQGSKTWGTLMLDYGGRPIPCSEHDVVDEEINNAKGMI